MPFVNSDNFFLINATDQDKAKLDMALAYAQMSPTSAQEIQNAVANNRVITIEIVSDGHDGYDMDTGHLRWDPNSALGVIDSAGEKGVQSAALGLIHEFIHSNDQTNLTTPTREAYALWKEDVIAQELKEPTRADYDSVFLKYETRNPTLHTTDEYGSQPIWAEKEQDGADMLGGKYSGEYMTPVLGDPIEPTSVPVCFGFWTTMEDPLQPEGSGNYINVWVEDPVILSLQGGPIQTQNVSTSNAYFDMQNDGRPMHTGWITENEGFLIYEKQVTGKINTEKELMPGLAALSALDSNHDGHLNKLDAEWSKLKIWKDAGLDGVFHQSELYKLSDLEIIDIDLNYKVVNEKINGNTISNVSHFTWDNGKVGEIASVELVAVPQHFEPA